MNGIEPAMQRHWTNIEKISFRIFFVFFSILILPFDLGKLLEKWLKLLDYRHLHIRDLGGLSAAGIDFISIKTESGQFGIASYVNWAIALGIAIILGMIWTAIDRKSTHYRQLYYFITAGVSMSMVMTLQGLTFSKVFPTQMPPLALTQLNTPYGDFTPQKLYWLQLSFVPRYQVFIGLAELAIMLLLFFRQTRALGAALALSMIGNIAISNHVYDGGIHLAASYYVIGGAFVLWRYLPGITKLLIRRQEVNVPVYNFPFHKKWQQYLRWWFKGTIFCVFFLLSAYLHWQNYLHDSYKVPARKGLANAAGFYQVDSFFLNKTLLPYSPVDSIRWRDVTFEKWSTLSFSVYRKFMIHGEAGRGKQVKDIDRTYESAGTGGGRRHYYYEADTVRQVLHLFNKNKVYKQDSFTMRYNRYGPDKIELSGRNEFKDSIRIILSRQNKKYTLYGDKNDIQ